MPQYTMKELMMKADIQQNINTLKKLFFLIDEEFSVGINTLTNNFILLIHGDKREYKTIEDLIKDLEGYI